MPLLLLLALVPLCSADFNCQGAGMANWNNNERQEILNIHNELRDKLKRGVYTARGEKIPKAKQMPPMAYDCVLEKSAQAYADSCPGTKHSKVAYGENLSFIWSTEPTQDINGKGINASLEWEIEFEEHGWPCNTITEKFLDDVPIGHATQMASARTTKVGCGVTLCKSSDPNFNSELMVVCHYDPSGNVLDAEVFESDELFPCRKAVSQMALICPLVLAVLSWYWLD